MNSISQQKIKNLLIVEDNKVTRFLNEVVIKKINLIENIISDYISKVISESELSTFISDYNKQTLLKTAV